MKQEQKAKAYDEAKYIMKEYLESGNAGVIAENTIKKAFPELRESEDERIRKSLISFLKSPFINESITDERVAPWLAWLEKQGEKPQRIISAEAKEAMYDKPADKVEPKFKVGDEIKTANEESLTITKIDEKGYWSEDLFICDFDEECLWDLVEQKPAWSEEDEKIYKKIETAIDSYYAPFSRDAEEMSKWFKNLKDRVQPHPKQEWSGEDAQMSNIIASDVLRIRRKCGIGTDEWNIRSEALNWFKSLRPQNRWKPTEEQLDALHDAAVYVDKSMFPYPKGILMKLYKQLKKLREE